MERERERGVTGRKERGARRESERGRGERGGEDGRERKRREKGERDGGKLRTGRRERGGDRREGEETGGRGYILLYRLFLISSNTRQDFLVPNKIRVEVSMHPYFSSMKATRLC